MDDKCLANSWIIVGVLALLPVLYLGSYWLLVRPFAIMISRGPGTGSYDVRHYRYGGDYAETVYWPLEQFDRRIRPGQWREPFYH